MSSMQVAKKLYFNGSGSDVLWEFSDLGEPEDFCTDCLSLKKEKPIVILIYNKQRP